MEVKNGFESPVKVTTCAAMQRQQRGAEAEAHHARRTAEMRDALEAERYAREEALLRQREEFEGHKRVLTRQIAERDELLETQRLDILNAAADEVRRAQEGASMKLEGAEAAADAPDPFGRFTAVKLDDVGLDRVERAPGQFGIGIDHQQHHLGLAAGLLAQFPRQV